MPFKKLLIATHNQGKFIEIKEFLTPYFNGEIVSLSDLNIKDKSPETGFTFEENAILKAKFYAKISNLPTIADDSGIIIEALKNELGLHTRRWGAGEKATDQKWIEYFLERMKQEDNKKAEFICIAAFYDLKEIKTFPGITSGQITEKLEAKYLPGLPLSAVFKPAGSSKVFSALSVAEKNKISHRGKAFSKLIEYLKNA